MKNGLRQIFLLLTVILVLSFAACGKSDAAGSEETEAEEETTPEIEVSETAPSSPKEAAGTQEKKENKPLTTVEKGKLTVAAAYDVVPYEFYTNVDGTPEMAGIEVSLVKYIADQLKLDLNLLPQSQEDAMNTLVEGKADLLILAIDPDPRFMEDIDFSDIYTVGGVSFVTLEKSAGNFKQPESLNRFECKIGVKKDSVPYLFLKQTAPNASAVNRQKTTEIIDDLLNSRIDGAYLSSEEARYYVKKNPDLTILFETDIGIFPSSIGIMKGNDALNNAVNKALASIKQEGLLDEYVAVAMDLTPVRPPVDAQTKK